MTCYGPRRKGRNRVFASMYTQHHSLAWLSLTFLLLLVAASDVETGTSHTEACDNPDLVQGQEQDKRRGQKTRMITPDELSTKNGVDETAIWISILGEVYDVTEGQDHYAPGKSYSGFAGRDGSVPFITGKFTAEEASKTADELKDSELPGLEDWRMFYRTHAVYKFVGKLIDPRYYSETSEPTEAMRQLEERIKTARVEYELKAKQRREEREKKRRGKKDGVRP